MDLCGRRTVDIVVFHDTVRRNVVVRVFQDVDKFEVLVHVRGHSHRVASQLLPNVFFKRGSLPTPHLLDVCIQVPG